jgi:hypothetical protein
VTIASIDPMVRPGPALAADVTDPAEGVDVTSPRGERRAIEPLVPPPRA